MARVRESPTVYLDTHIVAWLHAGLVDRLSPAATNALESAGMLFVSPIVELELTYLNEIGRFRSTATKALDVLSNEIGLRRSEIPLRESISEAVKLSWTRDPFDRLIVGEVLAAGALLVTRNRRILSNCPGAVW